MIGCDECINFPGAKSKQWAKKIKNYHICMGGRYMKFKLPKSPIDDPDSWGFYHKNCPLFKLSTGDSRMVGEIDRQEGVSTPPEELERQIMSSGVPKNEREWWAKRRIDELTGKLNKGESEGK